MNNRIFIDNQIRSGKPCIKGTRITVYDILGYLSAGDSIDQIVLNFPKLTKEDVLAALEFASIKEKTTEYIINENLN
jgi:uncharacterized protein (DUF433 family)